MATMDELVKQVQDLETATTDLLEATNVSKKTLDTAVNTSTEAAEQVLADAADVTIKHSATVQARDEAVAARDAATAIVYEGDASVTPAPGKIPVADGDGHIDKGYLDIFIRDSYRHAVESATGGKNTVLYDAHGNANVMVVIPKFTYDDIGMTAEMGTGVATAFMRSGTEIPEIFIAKYLGSGTHGVSVANADPRTSVNYDAAKGICEGKGTGWHLMTVHEWASISLWCMANGYQPRGNTQYGRAHDAIYEFGRRGDGRAPNDRNGAARINSGSGPAAWAHDNTDAGVYDLVGNIWEWQYGLKTQDGQVICTSDNRTDQLESQWVAQDCFFDSPQSGGAESGYRGTQFLNSQVTNHAGPVGDNGYYGDNHQAWESIAKDPSYISNELMKRLLIEPVGKGIQGRMYIRNYGERLPLRGGGWYNGSNAGLAALYVSNARTHAGSDIGFRPAFVA
ncbi:SUMF1/EgtB/PvdO family nonheme iron enzyme [Endozoicomonas sp. YOMI1]|uniref:SUMF1/EgtB/PvdO family nonheme iron enzyme n=1 Tax=Endozoicomonas sp. YOMI1 TaxID=2828739 RepID=UPI002148D81E|nr:SUMF1/EgtB/PvdO family nonheme iron enzyme [Endozoicomonas sp. YOMI1]